MNWRIITMEYPLNSGNGKTLSQPSWSEAPALPRRQSCRRSARSKAGWRPSTTRCSSVALFILLMSAVAAGAEPDQTVAAINEVAPWQQVGQQPYEMTWVQRREHPLPGCRSVYHRQQAATPVRRRKVNHRDTENTETGGEMRRKWRAYPGFVEFSTL